jgi:dipeptidyl aminopeptidase/acylaminoacyl peptidase
MAEVPISQDEELYTALRERNVPVELVTYSKQGHHRDPVLQTDMLRRNVEWFDRRTKPGPGTAQ